MQGGWLLNLCIDIAGDTLPATLQQQQNSSFSSRTEAAGADASGGEAGGSQQLPVRLEAVQLLCAALKHRFHMARPLLPALSTLIRIELSYRHLYSYCT